MWIHLDSNLDWNCYRMAVATICFALLCVHRIYICILSPLACLFLAIIWSVCVCVLGMTCSWHITIKWSTQIKRNVFKLRRCAYEQCSLKQPPITTQNIKLLFLADSVRMCVAHAIWAKMISVETRIQQTESRMHRPNKTRHTHTHSHKIPKQKPPPNWIHIILLYRFSFTRSFST